MARPKKYTQKFIRKEAAALVAYAKRTPVPLEKEFASRRGYSSQRLSEFAKESEEFSEALKKMKDLQETKILKAGLSGKVNVSMAIFTLKNVAGWRDNPPEEKCDRSLNLADLIKQVSEASKRSNRDIPSKKAVSTGGVEAVYKMKETGLRPIEILGKSSEDSQEQEIL